MNKIKYIPKTMVKYKHNKFCSLISPNCIDKYLNVEFSVNEFKLIHNNYFGENYYYIRTYIRHIEHIYESTRWIK